MIALAPPSKHPNNQRHVWYDGQQSCCEEDYIGSCRLDDDRFPPIFQQRGQGVYEFAPDPAPPAAQPGAGAAELPDVQVQDVKVQGEDKSEGPMTGGKNVELTVIGLRERLLAGQVPDKVSVHFVRSRSGCLPTTTAAVCDGRGPREDPQDISVKGEHNDPAAGRNLDRIFCTTPSFAGEDNPFPGVPFDAKVYVTFSYDDGREEVSNKEGQPAIFKYAAAAAAAADDA